MCIFLRKQIQLISLVVRWIIDLPEISIVYNMHKIKICVIGLGYVVPPLARLLSYNPEFCMKERLKEAVK